MIVCKIKDLKDKDIFYLPSSETVHEIFMTFDDDDNKCCVRDEKEVYIDIEVDPEDIVILLGNSSCVKAVLDSEFKHKREDNSRLIKKYVAYGLSVRVAEILRSINANSYIKDISKLKKEQFLENKGAGNKGWEELIKYMGKIHLH